MRYWVAGDAAGFDQRLAHTVANAAAEVECLVTVRRSSAEPTERPKMRVGEVAHMDKVADARAIGRRVVGAEQGEGRAETERCIGRQRQQMRLRVMGLADRPAGVR